MTKYYFDVHDGVDTVDHAGIDLPDREAARRHAHQLVADFAAIPENFLPNGHFVVGVREASALVMMTVRLVCMEEVATPR